MRDSELHAEEDCHERQSHLTGKDLLEPLLANRWMLGDSRRLTMKGSTMKEVISIQ